MNEAWSFQLQNSTAFPDSIHTCQHSSYRNFDHISSIPEVVGRLGDEVGGGEGDNSFMAESLSKQLKFQ